MCQYTLYVSYAMSYWRQQQHHRSLYSSLHPATIHPSNQVSLTSSAIQNLIVLVSILFIFNICVYVCLSDCHFISSLLQRRWRRRCCQQFYTSYSINTLLYSHLLWLFHSTFPVHPHHPLFLWCLHYLLIMQKNILYINM